MRRIVSILFGIVTLALGGCFVTEEKFDIVGERVQHMSAGRYHCELKGSQDSYERRVHRIIMEMAIGGSEFTGGIGIFPSPDDRSAYKASFMSAGRLQSVDVRFARLADEIHAVQLVQRRSPHVVFFARIGNDAIDLLWMPDTASVTRIAGKHGVRFEPTLNLALGDRTKFEDFMRELAQSELLKSLATCTVAPRS